MGTACSKIDDQIDCTTLPTSVAPDPDIAGIGVSHEVGLRGCIPTDIEAFADHYRVRDHDMAHLSRRAHHQHRGFQGRRKKEIYGKGADAARAGPHLVERHPARVQRRGMGVRHVLEMLHDGVSLSADLTPAPARQCFADLLHVRPSRLGPTNTASSRRRFVPSPCYCSLPVGFDGSSTQLLRLT